MTADEKAIVVVSNEQSDQIVLEQEEEVLTGTLSEEQKAELAVHESVIDEYRKFYHLAGKAFEEIHKNKLYREYGTFAKYAFEKWGYSRVHAWRLIRASQVYDNIEDIGWIPENESVIRPLTPKVVTLEDQRLIATIIHETALDGVVDEPHVKSLVTVLKDIKNVGAVDDGDGGMIPIKEATTQHLKAAILQQTKENMLTDAEVIRQKRNSKQNFIGRFHAIPIVRGSDTVELQGQVGTFSEINLGQEYVFVVYQIERPLPDEASVPTQ